MSGQLPIAKKEERHGRSGKVGVHCRIGNLCPGSGASFSWFSFARVILDLILGFLNVSSKEARAFLIAAVALTISASAMQSLPLAGEWVTNIMAGLVVLVSPAILVVAVKALLNTAQNELPQTCRCRDAQHTKPGTCPVLLLRDCGSALRPETCGNILFR
jgi:hypothetical protein